MTVAPIARPQRPAPLPATRPQPPYELDGRPARFADLQLSADETRRVLSLGFGQRLSLPGRGVLVHGRRQGDVRFPTPVVVFGIGGSREVQIECDTYAEVRDASSRVRAEGLRKVVVCHGMRQEVKPSADYRTPWRALQYGWIWLGSGPEEHDPAGCGDSLWAHPYYGIVRVFTTETIGPAPGNGGYGARGPVQPFGQMQTLSSTRRYIRIGPMPLRCVTCDGLVADEPHTNGVRGWEHRGCMIRRIEQRSSR